MPIMINSDIMNAIRAHHAAQVQIGVALALEHCVNINDESRGELHTSVAAAARTMGFIEADAQALAHAWCRQSERLGRFDATVWPDHPADFGWSTPEAHQRFAPCPYRLGLYAVLPDAHWIARMAQAGVPTLQLRFKSDDPQAIDREVQKAVRAVEGSASLLFINDHWQAAIEHGAYGVHLGQEDLQAEQAGLSRLRTAGLRLGLSTHGYAEMGIAAAVGPSYLALGAIYPTTLKRMATAPQGPGRLARYARLAREFPQVAIGGIDADRMPQALASGVGSVAVVRALVAASNPQAEAARLMAIIAQAGVGQN
jgi:thiamine-phosphate pyrophosphorylase